MTQVDTPGLAKRQSTQPIRNGAKPARIPETPAPPAASKPPRVWVSPTAAVMARWPWLVAGGVSLGILSAIAPVSGLTDATATIQMTGSNLDSLRAKQVGQTIERAVRSEPVIAEAARTRNIAATDLAPRVKAQWVSDTDLITISVTGADGDAAVKDANSVADAVIAVNERQAKAQLEQIQKESNRLLTSGTLSDTQAETARRSQLGSNVGVRQDSATAASTQVALLDPAVEARPSGVSSSVRLMLGFIAGALLAAAAAILVPMNRRRVRAVAEVRSLSTGLRVKRASGAVGDAAGRMVEVGNQDLAVVALPGAGDDAVQFAESVARIVRSHGMRTTVLNAVNREVGEALLSRDGRARSRTGHAADALIVVVHDDEWALRLLEGQSALRSVVVARSHHSLMGDLWRVTGALELSRPLVVVDR